MMGAIPRSIWPRQQRRRRTLEALILQIEVLARSCPVLMIVEDVHWADPSSLEVLVTGRWIVTFPVLLVVDLPG